MKFSKKLTAAAAIVAAGFASNAAAEKATDTIEVYAGLAPVFELVCSDVKFGVWRVPVRTSIEVTTITLGADSVAVIGDNTNDVALSSASDAQPAAGDCTFTGSTAPVGTESMGVTLSASSGSMVAAGDGDYAGLDAPQTPLVNELNFTISGPGLTAVDENGEGSFKITGVLTIPGNIIEDNYGGYKGSSITVTIDEDI